MPQHFIVTANRLDDGGVTYLSADPATPWVPSLDHAFVTADRTLADQRLAFAHGCQREVCDPYVIEVELRGETPRAVSARERIRAEGPAITRERLGVP